MQANQAINETGDHATPNLCNQNETTELIDETMLQVMAIAACYRQHGLLTV